MSKNNLEERCSAGSAAALDGQHPIINSLQQNYTFNLGAGTANGEAPCTRLALSQRDWIAAKFAAFRPKAEAFWALRTGEPPRYANTCTRIRDLHVYEYKRPTRVRE